MKLPPLPYSLHPRAGQRKFPGPAQLRSPSPAPGPLHPYGRYEAADSAVVVEAAPPAELGRMMPTLRAFGALAGTPRHF